MHRLHIHSLIDAYPIPDWATHIAVGGNSDKYTIVVQACVYAVDGNVFLDGKPGSGNITEIPQDTFTFFPLPVCHETSKFAEIKAACKQYSVFLRSDAYKDDTLRKIRQPLYESNIASAAMNYVYFGFTSLIKKLEDEDAA